MELIRQETNPFCFDYNADENRIELTYCYVCAKSYVSESFDIHLDMHTKKELIEALVEQGRHECW